jgi:hypothetical protein
MHATEQQFQLIRDEAWKADHAEAMDCHRAEDLIVRVLRLWDDHQHYFTSHVPGSMDRTATREMFSTLRIAEQAVMATLKRAMASVEKGFSVVGMDKLIPLLFEVREQLLLPMARRMAQRDTDGRSASEIARLLLRRVRFEDGRPVITEADVVDLPCPYDPEPEPVGSHG